jgi:hypothetical protein
VQVKGLEEEAERAAEAEQATLAAMRRDAEETQVRQGIVNAADNCIINHVMSKIFRRNGHRACNCNPAVPLRCCICLCMYSCQSIHTILSMH